jgi:hypothetical protein
MPSLIFLGAFCWGFVLIASFAGYGAVVGRLLRYRRTDGGLAVSWGLSLLLAVGAVLNLARAISPRVIVVLVLTGVAAWVVLGGPYRLARATRRLTRWDALLCAVLLVGYLNWLCYSRRPEPGKPLGSHVLHILDDSAYLLFPARMLQTGSMGIDPFSDRLSVSLSGEAFVQSLVLAVLPVEYIHLADPGLAFLAMGILVMTARRLTAPARFVLGALFAVWPTSSTNASAVALPVVFLFALTRLMSRPTEGKFLSAGLGLALPLSALLSLKSTMIPGGVLLVFSWGVSLSLWTRRIGPVVVGSLTGLFALVMLLPWMLCSYQSAGTLLYPYLGEGFRRYTPIVALPNKSPWLLKSPGAAIEIALTGLPRSQMLTIVFGVVLATVCVAVRGASRIRLATLTAVCTAGLTTIALMVVAFGTIIGSRYAYPFAIVTALVAYATTLRMAQGGGRWRLARAASYLVIGGAIPLYATRAVLSSRDLPDSIAGALTGQRRFPEEEVRRYRALQASIPPETRFFSLLKWPILFDLSRNDPYYPDNPGIISPPPGIPLRERSGELVDYLKSQGIRYMACPSTDAIRAHRRDGVRAVPQDNRWGEISALLRAYMQFMDLAYERFIEIADRYPTVYADRQVRMIDLEGPDHPPTMGDPDRVASAAVRPGDPGRAVENK